MKHLYRIDVEHSAPKDRITAIAGYVITNTDEIVYEFLKGDQVHNPFSIYTGWYDKEDKKIKTFGVINPETGEEGYIEETWKEKMIRLKGEINDEEREYEGAYYGITYYGWKDLGKVDEKTITTLISVLKEDLIIID